MQWLKSSGGGKSLSAEEGWKEKVKAQLFDLMLWTQQIVRFIAETILIVFVTKQTFSCFVVWQKSYYLHFFKNIDCCLIDNKLDLDLDLVEEAKI